MKRACLVVVMCWLLPAPAFATPCVSGSLASYVALGAGGCNVGTAQFFNFLDLPLQGGAAAIPDSAVFVNPVDDADGRGFRFDVNSDAAAGDLFERVIGFSLSGPGFIGSRLALTGTTATFDGGVTVLQKGCVGAEFGPGQFCNGNDAPLSAFDLDLFGQSLEDSLTFAPAALLGVIVDITVDGGEAGAAGLASVTTQFAAGPTAPTLVPEPATLSLLALGLAAGTRRHRGRNKTVSPVNSSSASVRTSQCDGRAS
jgi:hypothetical protein